MRYEQVDPISHEDAEIVFQQHNSDTIRDALVRIAFHDPDWKWAQMQCLKFLNFPDKSVRQVAITCLGHIARIHRTLDIDRVIPVLEALLSDPDLAGVAKDGLDDIKQFTNQR